ncbi:hydrogenase maturation protease [Nonomuraea sp. bgisy094]|uniref:hydrogenase maturation protease n=1 Tax=Nonomuraea sp. bgisy094 TaxID=3413781 RepID=UPI003EBF7434
MSRTVLVAGVGNVFLGDDGFGVEVARRLLSEAGLPEGVVVADFGIRGIHLAYELLTGYDEVILIDAVPMDEPPGTLTVLEPALDEAGPVDDVLARGALTDAHGMTPDAIFGLLRAFGVTTGRILLVGCRPADTSPGMELSEAVARAVPHAAELVRDLVRDLAVPERQGGVHDVQTRADRNDGGRDRRPGVAVPAGHQALPRDPGDVSGA